MPRHRYDAWTPSASDTRKKAAGEASSLSSVTRAKTPAARATARPAIMPPDANADRATALTTGNPSAARAGSHAPWRRPPNYPPHMSMTPIGPAPSAQRKRGDKCTPHEIELKERRDQDVVGHGSLCRRGDPCTSGRLSTRARLRTALPHMWRALRDCPASAHRRLVPHATGARASSSTSGNLARRARGHAGRRRPCVSRRASAAPAVTDPRRLASTALNGSSSTIKRAF